MYLFIFLTSYWCFYPQRHQYIDTLPFLKLLVHYSVIKRIWVLFSPYHLHTIMLEQRKSRGVPVTELRFLCVGQ